MKIIINKEEMKKEWVIESWYEKTYYVIGIIMFWWMTLAFAVGFLEGLSGK